MNNGKQPITPMFNSEGMPTYYDGKPNFGLTKREYFAAMAMKGILSNPSQIGATTDFEWVAIHAIGYADKLLKQLEL